MILDRLFAGVRTDEQRLRFCTTAAIGIALPVSTIALANGYAVYRTAALAAATFIAVFFVSAMGVELSRYCRYITRCSRGGY